MVPLEFTIHNLENVLLPFVLLLIPLGPVMISQLPTLDGDQQTPE